ncbi:FadR/GntR family transcriptional regulator [Peptoniphilus stercorisuis]|uniref:GntR family transcriptional repressor for pyruvate dehydrogenase complex n=1 Tax=Peptoniphilus stercorisuis TaxID=1436965 RepID=A0ABS4KAC5_9FIRM|nr:GntR family transcriptional regulator [Peptoniphilus stercorisuis]MBP2024725.1 GntR family transcriptional repressor for pyruvate dehydrogenase complex [Peptoniphilus stercorisuis]
MDKIYEKSYEKLIDYVKTKILQKEYSVGDKLPSERELAKILEISRNSVREGIRILERMGVISCQHGSGNFVTGQFDKTLTEVLSMMYVLKGMNMEEITDFRFGLEYGAVNLAVKNVNDDQKERLMMHLKNIENAETEEIRAFNDKEMHYLLAEASENIYIISTFNALNQIMETYVPQMREKIFIGMETEIELAKAHRNLVEGVVEGNLEKALEGLFNHFKYIRLYLEK